MSVKGMLWVLGLAGAAALAVVWVAERLPASQGTRATGVAAPSAQEAPAAPGAGGPRGRPAGVSVARPLPRDTAAAPAEIGTDDAGDPAGSQERLAPADRFGDPPAAPAPEGRAAAAPSLAVTALCAPTGSRCGSSADCCPGLACDGGMAGYGTVGRCR